MALANEALTITRDPIWPWSSPHVGLYGLGAVALILIVLTIWTYRGVAGISSRRLFIVLLLRLTALAITIAMLLRPSLVSREHVSLPSTLLLVFDRSESMSIQDEIDGRSRWNYLRDIVARAEPILQQLYAEQNITTIRYAFAEDLGAFDPDGNADGKRTDFGQMLHSVYENHGREQNLRGIVIVSDGADNGTRYAALVEAGKLRGLPCPISTFGVGKPTTSERQRDISFTAISTEPSPVAAKGKLTVKGIIDAPGFENTNVTVHLLIDGKEVLAEKQNLPKTFENEIKLTTDAPAKAGEIKVTLKVDPLPGEITQLNNEISTYVTVTQEGISILFVDRPRFPEPQLICDALSADPRIRLFTAWRRTDEPSAELADLFQFEKQHYDVIVLGDLSARRLTGGNPEVLAKIQDLVRNKGTGFMMMGGYDSFGNSDWRGTPVEDLLPVKLDTSGQSEERWRMEPTPAGLAHYILRLTEKPSDNRVLWNKLPELDGRTLLGEQKPGATVLATRAGTKEPVLVSQPYGNGRTLAFAGDTTWRWQRLGQPKSAQGLELHARFWKQMVLWLAKQDEAEGNVWVKPDARRLPAGSKLGFSVGLRGKGGLKPPEASFEVTVVDPQGTEFAVPTAQEQDDERGTFWKTDLAGEYRLIVRGRGKDADGQAIADSAIARFLIYQDDAEMVRRAADHEFLTKLANSGGGKFYRAETLPDFLRELENLPLPQAKSKFELWPDWKRKTLSTFRVSLFLGFVAVLCLEWLLRRRWGLV